MQVCCLHWRWHIKYVSEPVREAERGSVFEKMSMNVESNSEAVMKGGEESERTQR